MQKELAAEANVSEYTVLRAEKGVSLRVDSARKIAEALGVSVADLQERPPVPLGEAPGDLPKVEAPTSSHREEDEERRSVPEALKALNSYTIRRTKTLEAELKEKNSPHFKNATAATVWVAGVQREAKDWADCAVEEWATLLPQGGGFTDPEPWRDAFKVLGPLMTFHEITRRAEKRITEMKDQPDELVQKRLEKDRREAQESERRLNEFRAAASG
jgi:transcriptional regulator with XRE-family HTH domain